MIKPWSDEEGCQHPAFPEFKRHLNQASYHYADDSAKEWFKADEAVRKAAEIAIENEWPYWAIVRMVQEVKSLVGVDQFMTAMLKTLYARDKEMA